MQYVWLRPSLYGDLWQALQESLNFSYSMVHLTIIIDLTLFEIFKYQVLSVDGYYGIEDSNGAFNGMVCLTDIKSG